jgi:hypothetical protein
VVEQHKLTVLLAHLVLVQFPLTIDEFQISIILSTPRFVSSNIRELENQGGFTAVHARFKSSAILLATITISLCKILTNPLKKAFPAAFTPP